MYVDEVLNLKMAIYYNIIRYYIPDYEMELDSGGSADFEPELRTDMKDKNIFYIRVNYFRIGN
jgi:hypothetical protein